MPKQSDREHAIAASVGAVGLLYRQSRLVITLSLLLCLALSGTATATSTSTNYSVTETQFGTGASLHDCSTNYCAKTSAGDTAAGDTGSSNYSAQAGSNTSEEPLLEVTSAGGIQNLGVLDPTSSTTAGTATFTIGVRSYLSNGYVMQISGSPPSQGSHALTPIWPTPSTSHPGAEQFGINLVANNTPAIGANPTEDLAGLGTGVVTSNYIVPDLFTYNDGDTVAQSDSSSAGMTYTVSMILNVSNTTPGGKYVGALSAVVVPLY